MASAAVARGVVGYEELVREMRKVPYLARYVMKIVREAGWPEYYTGKLPGHLKRKVDTNLIYPIGNGIYIHIYMPPGGTESGYRKYIAIEPPRPPQIIFDLIEEKIAELATEGVPEEPEEKKKALLAIIEKVVDVVDGKVDYEALLRRKKPPKKIPVSRADYEYLKYYFIRDRVGLGVLEPFILDTYIEDISAVGVGPIFIVHKVFGPLETSIRFNSMEELDMFVIQLSERIGKPVSHARPIVDATLPDGSRINIVFGSDVSLHGSNFTIRKFTKKPISVIQLIKWGTLDEYVGAYLWILLLEGMSGFISGETASGKTTSLNAIIAFIRPTAKIITIEDTAEVQVPHPNWVRELTRDTGSLESSVTLFDLLKAALRQRPNYIIVGEIRGAEGNVAFQAMQSVSWDTPVLIKNARTGETRLVKIGEFVDRYYEGGEERVPKPVNDWLVLSMDRYGRVKWSKIRYVLRHRASEIYEITYEGKGTLKATGSHSVFVLDEDTLEVRPKPVSQLKKGDLLISFVRRGGDSGIKTIDVYEMLSKHSERVKEVDKKYVRIGNSRPLGKKLLLNEDLAYLLGAYLADGCIEHKQDKNPVIALSMGSDEWPIMEEVIDVASGLGAHVSIRDRGTYSIVRIHNAPLAYAVADLVGKNLMEKHVPRELWDSPPDVIKKFFEGYMADARRTNIRGGIVVYTTKNRELATQLIWLARLAGLESKMFEIRDRRYGNYYDIHVRLFQGRGIRNWGERIPLKPLIKLLERNNLVSKLPLELTYIVRRYRQGTQRYVLRKTARKIVEFVEKYWNRLDEESRRLLERLKKFIESDIALLEIISIRKVRYEGFVYDISVPETELFIGGEVPIALHNTGHPVLATFHAGSVARLVQRLTSPPINVPKTQLDNLNFVIIQSAVYREGVMLRRMLSVNEILGYDPGSDTIVFLPVFTWDPTNDKFIFRGRGSSYLLEEKIGLMRGIPRTQLKLIYRELDLRAKILRLMAEKNIIDYYDVFRMFARIYTIIDSKAKTASKEMMQQVILDALEEVVKKIERGDLRP